MEFVGEQDGAERPPTVRGIGIVEHRAPCPANHLGDLRFHLGQIGVRRFGKVRARAQNEKEGDGRDDGESPEPQGERFSPARRVLNRFARSCLAPVGPTCGLASLPWLRSARSRLLRSPGLRGCRDRAIVFSGAGLRPAPQADGIATWVPENALTAAVRPDDFELRHARRPAGRRRTPAGSPVAR